MSGPDIVRREESHVIKTLVSIEVDLVSSLAVRFACQLGGFMEVEIHPVYVKESPTHDSIMGAGWASRTWERQMIEQGKEEISELIDTEKEFCPVLGDPKVIYGDREAELLKIANLEDFDLYMEGVHFPWTPGELYKRIHTKLYQKLPSTPVLVRTLRKINQVLLLCLDVAGTESLSGVFQKIWKNCPVPLELVVPNGEVAQTGSKALRQAVENARAALEKSGHTVHVHDKFPVGPEEAAEALKEYGLVAAAIERNIKKDAPELAWLNLVKTSLLLAFH
jgi:hypothetical protein